MIFIEEFTHGINPRLEFLKADVVIGFIDEDGVGFVFPEGGPQHVEPDEGFFAIGELVKKEFVGMGIARKFQLQSFGIEPDIDKSKGTEVGPNVLKKLAKGIGPFLVLIEGAIPRNEVAQLGVRLGSFAFALLLYAAGTWAENEDAADCLFKGLNREAISRCLDGSEGGNAPIERKARFAAIVFLEANVFHRALEDDFAIAGRLLLNDARLEIRSNLLEVQNVGEGLTVHLEVDLKLLSRRVLPIGEIEVGNIPFAVSSENAIPGAKISDETEGVEDRAFSGPIRSAKDLERVKFHLKCHKAPEIIDVEAGECGLGKD